MKTRALFFLFFLLPWFTSNTWAGKIIATSAEYAAVNSAVASANTGDTVFVPADTATWDSPLIITKGIILMGAGKFQTKIISNITNQDAGIIKYAPASLAANEPFRITGFSFDGNLKSNIIYIHAYGNSLISINKIRIDHNDFKDAGGNNAGRCIAVGGSVFGVIDNNHFSGKGKKIDFHGDGQSTWTNATFEFGSADNMYFEDNTFDIDDTPHSGGNGAKYCGRFNTYNTPFSLWPCFDWHGNMGPGGNYSTMGVEIYNNTINSGTRDIQFDARGGKAMVFDNTLVVTSGYGFIRVREEYDDATNPPAVSPVSGQPQYVTDSYFWNNTMNGNNRFNAILSDFENLNDLLAENREFFNQKDGFDGTQGIGVGLLANRPTTCVTGVGYWATDDGGDWNKKNSTPQDGSFYKCTSTNVWTAYYTPYIYPHPLRSIGVLADSIIIIDTIAPSAPSGLNAGAVSSSQVNLTWTSSTDSFLVTGYFIYRNAVYCGMSNRNSFSDKGLTANTQYTYTIVAFDASGNASVPSGAAAATTLNAGVPDGGDSSIKVTPNPVGNTLYINQPYPNSMLIISDINGKRIIEKKLANTNETIDVSMLSSGLYIIEIITGGKKHPFKITKQ